MIVLRTCFVVALVYPLLACEWIADLNLSPEKDSSPEKVAESTPNPVTGPAESTPTPPPNGIVISTDSEISASESLEVIQKRLDQRERLDKGLPPDTPTPTPTIAIVDPGPGIRTAPTLHLMWTTSPQGAFRHGDALIYCTNFEAASFTDWRAPTIDELDTIRRAGLGLDTPGRGRHLWSSTKHHSRGHEVIDVDTGAISMIDSGLAHIICVREIAP